MYIGENVSYAGFHRLRYSIMYETANIGTDLVGIRVFYAIKIYGTVAAKMLRHSRIH
jgi:hypothetical protein